MVWVVSVAPRPRFSPREKDLRYPIGSEAGWASQNTEARGKILCLCRDWTPLGQSVVRHYIDGVMLKWYKNSQLFSLLPLEIWCRVSSVSIVTSYGVSNGFRFPPGFKYPLTSASRPTLGPIQSPYNVYQGPFPREQNVQGLKLTTHVHLVSISRKSRPVTIHRLP
jgi:hypothetical protein